MYMTISQINKAYDYRMKRVEYDNKQDNIRTARICMILANINRKKGTKVFTEKDFLPKEKAKQRKKQSVDSMNSVLKMLTIMHGGTIEG